MKDKMMEIQKTKDKKREKNNKQRPKMQGDRKLKIGNDIDEKIDTEDRRKDKDKRDI